ncbi:MAG: DUF484 family protein [Woeseia sp.]|nr:DUF484 family protein [Woeseia sp.]MBT8096440.1 DUF484 family protein [Woeseia sp.]NNE59887.1 DUF484 family protein [Woeseia sp.]NNL53706.1 DUF484 family protein [Woeseia sp.]
MSSQMKPEFAAEPLSEQTVHDFLEDHPDFFERHKSLLGALRLPHVTGGTVSLVERQVSVLRQKDIKLERRLRELLTVARANDVLATKIHNLAVSLLATKNLEETLAAIERSLRAEFDAEHSVLVLFGEPDNFTDIGNGRFFRPMRRESETLAAFSTFLESDSPRCGQTRDAQRDFLFPGNTDEVGSVALVPLGSRSATGFLAIGSADANRFHPGMSIDFLGRIGDLVAAALRRY